MTRPELAGRRWLPVLLFVVLVAASAGQVIVGGPALISVDPTGGKPGTTVTVRLTNFLAYCTVSFDGRAMTETKGCDDVRLSFPVPLAAAVGDHEIFAHGEDGPDQVVERVATFRVIDAVTPVPLRTSTTPARPARSVPTTAPRATTSRTAAPPSTGGDGGLRRPAVMVLLGALAALGLVAAAVVARRALRSRRSAGAAAAGAGPESWRTSLKAAYFVGGEQGQEVFAWAAGSRNPEVRKAVAYSLYLLWRRDPPAVYGVLEALGRRVGRLPIGRTSRILQTLSDTSITIYINHPEEPDLAAEVSRLWSEVLKGRLRLHRRRWLEPAVIPVLSTVFSRRILETALLGQDPERFFHADAGLRARFARVVPQADPTATLERTTIADDLAALFESPVHLHNVLAALTVAIHAAGDFESVESLVRELHDRVDAHGRLWLLQAFSVLLPGTPPSWLLALEELTTDLVTRDRETFLTRDGGQLGGFDIALLPLGLAYAKTPDARGMPGIDAILADAIHRDDRPLVARVVEGLAPIGFHYPEVLFRSLRPVMAALLAEVTSRDALASTLADTRTVWFDEVDLFLREMGAPTEFRQQVAIRTKPERMTRLVAWVGLYNNAVHQALAYPIMREHLLLGGLHDLATAPSPRRFVSRYTRRVLKLLHQADFELIRWTDLST